MQRDTLDPVSNKATWVQDYTLFDEETGDAIDLDGTTEITIAVRDARTGVIWLTGTYTGGEVTIVGDTTDGTFEWEFSADQMGALCALTYEVGLTLEIEDQTIQLLIGRLPVLDGIVP